MQVNSLFLVAIIYRAQRPLCRQSAQFVCKPPPVSKSLTIIHLEHRICKNEFRITVILLGVDDTIRRRCGDVLAEEKMEKCQV